MITKQQAWEAIEKASKLTGYASESRDIPDHLRDKLIDVLAALVWVSQSIRCPSCGNWQVK
jgi:hypothetical protein